MKFVAGLIFSFFLLIDPIWASSYSVETIIEGQCIVKKLKSSSKAIDFCANQYLMQMNRGITECYLNFDGACSIDHTRTTYETPLGECVVQVFACSED